MLVHNEAPVEISSQLHSRAGAKRPLLEIALIERSTAAMRVMLASQRSKGLRSRCDRAEPATHHLPRSLSCGCRVAGRLSTDLHGPRQQQRGLARLVSCAQ